MRAKFYLLSLLCIGANSSLAWSASAPPNAYELQLQELLDSRQYDALTLEIGKAKDLQSRVRLLNWYLAQQMANGQGIFVTMLYSAGLFAVANEIPSQRSSELKESAAAQYLLAQWIIRTEGFQCVDQESPIDRAEFLKTSALGVEIQKYLDQLAPERRTYLYNLAFTNFILSFSIRKNDDWLCRIGPHFSAKYAEKHPEVASKSGGNGVTIVDDDPSIQAEFVPFSEWKGKRIEAIHELDRELGMPPPPNILLEGSGKMK